MKAIIYEKYGPPDVLRLEEIEKPEAGDGEVLVRVQVASVNPFDWHILTGKPFGLRLMGFGFLKPKCRILGADVVGTVEAMGRNTGQFKPGDEVFGDISATGLGAFAEYVCVPENVLLLKPANVGFEEAAAAPLAGVTALQALRDKGRVRAGQKVLVNGASGGVGTIAVQIAKSYGAEVAGVCSTKNVEMVQSIGADEVIDYTQHDFARNENAYDLIFDAVAKRSFIECRLALKPKGVFVTTAFSPFLVLWGKLTSMYGGKKLVPMLMNPNRDDLLTIEKLLETTKVRPVIDRRYPLEETAEALRYLEKGHARGKVLIIMDGGRKV